MANLFYGKVSTNNKYVDVAEATGVTISEDIIYLLQPQGVVALYIGTGDAPEDGGFMIFNNAISRFKLSSDEKIYIKTFGPNGAFINLAS